MYFIMKGIEKLLSQNYEIENKKKKIIRHRGTLFDGDSLKQILEKLKSVMDCNEKKNKELIIKTSDLIFIDKATYILFETIFYFVCKETQIKIKFENNQMRTQIGEKITKHFLLQQYKNKFIDKEKFIKDFEKKKLTKESFRDILKVGDKPDKISILLDEIESSLKIYNISEDCRSQFSEVVTELVGNAVEHAKTDCLLDLSSYYVYHKDDNHRSLYLDVVVLNFSDILLGDGIKNKCSLFNKFLEDDDFRKDLRIAYKNHKNKFGTILKKEAKKKEVTYLEQDFYNISAFQWRFSGRKETIKNNGGTGLTTFIKFLLKNSEANRCYVQTGDRIIRFKNALLTSGNNKQYIGFNKMNDYLNNIPDSEALDIADFYLNGTIYNLVFVLSLNEKEG